MVALFGTVCCTHHGLSPEGSYLQFLSQAPIQHEREEQSLLAPLGTLPDSDQHQTWRPRLVLNTRPDEDGRVARLPDGKIIRFSYHALTRPSVSEEGVLGYSGQTRESEDMHMVAKVQGEFPRLAGLLLDFFWTGVRVSKNKKTWYRRYAIMKRMPDMSLYRPQSRHFLEFPKN